MNILNNKPITIKEMNIEQLQAKLATTKKTSSKRETQLPDSYDVIQPLFVSLRGQIGKGIITDTVINAMFADILKHANLIMTESLAKKLFGNTVYHNSYSNIANKNQVKEAKDCLNRYVSFLAMAKQAEVMLPLLPKAYINEATEAVFNHAKYPFDKPEAAKPAKPEAAKPAKAKK